MDAALEDAEHAAMRTQWCGLPGATVAQVGGLHVFAAAGPPWLTQVCGLGLSGSVDDLDAALARAPGALVQVVEGRVPDVELERRGYRRGPPLARLAAMSAAEQPRLRVEVVGREQAALVEELARTGFGLDLPGWLTAPLGRPGWTQVVAYDEGVPVATGGLHVAGSPGWVGAAATVPVWRGRGAQTALLAARLRLAAEQGAARVSVKVEPGGTSARNLRRAGFVEAHRVTQWALRR